MFSYTEVFCSHTVVKSSVLLFVKAKGARDLFTYFLWAFFKRAISCNDYDVIRTDNKQKLYLIEKETLSLVLSYFCEMRKTLFTHLFCFDCILFKVEENKQTNGR